MEQHGENKSTTTTRNRMKQMTGKDESMDDDSFLAQLVAQVKKAVIQELDLGPPKKRNQREKQ